MPKNLNENLETYEIEIELGQDDLTIDYRAYRKSDNYPVIIKVIAPQFTYDSYFVRRFKDAVTRNIDLIHPNIIKTYEVGERDDILYLATEFVEADTLADYLQTNGPLPINKVISFVKQLASALDYAHSKAIRHGNLSDTNIFVKDEQIWIADFGLIQTMEGTSLVKKGFAVGNPNYLSSERVKGESASRTADLYALGIITYQMLIGKPPFSGEATSVLHAQVYEQVQPPHLLNTHIRPAISEVVLRMLSKGLELRHSTGAEFANALQVAAKGSAPIQAVQDNGTTISIGQQKTPIWRRFAFWVFLLTPLLGCALAGGFWAINRIISTPTVTPTVVAVVDTPAPTPVPTFKIDVSNSTTNTQAEPPEPTATLPLIATVTSVPTLTPIPLPGEPIIANDSPFTNLVLAHDITEDYQPNQPSNTFDPRNEPIYLFFDYNAIQPGSAWGLIWRWDGVVLEESQDIWPEDYSSVGTAWVYFAPSLGFQPGPYSVSLQVEGDVVAAIDFIVQ